jgi:general transcriptional corepressor TUP1
MYIRFIMKGTIYRLLPYPLVSLTRGDSVVSCVKFSVDGKYLATGGNRATQIYDVTTGAKTWCVHPSLSSTVVTELLIVEQCSRGTVQTRRPVYTAVSAFAQM